MSERLKYEVDGDVARITLDDGKANVFGPPMIEDVGEALDRATRDAKAVLLMGRAGMLSGGFDLAVIRSGDRDAMVAMLNGGGRLLMRLYGHPQPLVVAATGHAIALGSLVLLTGDYRLGVEGEFRIGLNETTIGMALPEFALTLAKARLSKRHLSRATLAATMYDPAGAADVGYLDEVVAPGEVAKRAGEVAAQLAQLDAAAFAASKRSLRGADIDKVLAGLS